jgi:hypothetical protein
MSDQVRVCAEALKLALLVQAQKHNGSFETQHKTGDGKDITVTRGPGGQFASPGTTESPKNNFVSQVEDLQNSVNKVISENASKLKSALQSKPVTDFNNNLASQLEKLLGKGAGDAYRSAASSLPDVVTQSEMKLKWATNDIAQTVKKFPDVAKGAAIDPLSAAKFAGALAEESAIAVLGAIVLSSAPAELAGLRVLVAGSAALGVIGAYHGANRIKALFDKLAETGTQDDRFKKISQELEQQINEMETPAAEETPTQKAISLSLGVSSKLAEKVAEALKTSKIDPDAVRQALNRQMANREAFNKHALRERVLELTALRQNPKKSKDDKDSIGWHEGVIKSELRYGAAIDQLLESVDFKNSQKVEREYQAVISLIDKGKSESEIRQLSPFESRYIEFLLLKKAGKHLETEDPKVVQRVQDCTEAAQLFGRLTKQELDVRVGFVAPDDPTKDIGQNRGYQDNFFNIPGAGESFIHTGFAHDPKTVMFHELGHVLEVKLNNSAITHNYAKDRAISNEEVQLKYLTNNPAYRDYEKARPSDFRSPYSAKLYEGNSEIISTATETLTSWQSLSLQAKQDRDHLLFGLYALDQ